MKKTPIRISAGIIILAIAAIGIWYAQRFLLSGNAPPASPAGLAQDVVTNAEFRSWFSEWQKVLPALSENEFYLAGGGALDPDFSRQAEEEDLQAPLANRYVFSPDGRRFLDYLASVGEPDSAVYLYTLNGYGLLERIRFCGTPCRFDHAFWLDDDRFAILGVSEVTAQDGKQKCDVPDDVHTCYAQLTVDLYDLALTRQTRYLSAEHIFSEFPFVGSNMKKWRESVEKSNLIRIAAPKPYDIIQSPVRVQGEARGTWFFEASFPVRLLDGDGKEIAVGIAQAQGEWMTEDFVPFEALIEFQPPATSTGTLVLEKDNPSGLPEHADEVSIAIRFEKTDTKEGTGASPPLSNVRCLVTGCSGQVCAEEEVITTCEFRPEYACYRNARCERQQDGQCGWTLTEELSRCLQDARS